MSDDLEKLLTLHQGVRAGLDREESEVAGEEGRAHLLLQDCAVRRSKIGAKRRTLDEAEALYRQYFGAPIPTEPLPINLPRFEERRVDSEQEKPKPRARIGPQRYRMLHLLRSHPGVALSEGTIATRTDLSAKRVRDQMRGDVSDGIAVRIAEDRYAITSAGLDLLDRFESYKREKGQSLPSLTGPIGDGDDDDPVAEESLTEELAA